MNEPDAPRETLPLTPVVFHVLLALADGPAHGYGIAREAEEASGGAVSMGPGTLYGSLQRLDERGLIREAATPDDARGRHTERRKYYRITDAGRSALRAEASRLSRVVERARDKVALDGGGHVGGGA